MDSGSLRDRIRRSFTNALHIDMPADDTDLFDAGVIDSLAFVELLLFLEQEFGVTTAIEDLEVENFKSIARIAEFVVARSAAPPASHGLVVSIGSQR